MQQPCSNANYLIARLNLSSCLAFASTPRMKPHSSKFGMAPGRRRSLETGHPLGYTTMRASIVESEASI